MGYYLDDLFVAERGKHKEEADDLGESYEQQLLGEVLLYLDKLELSIVAAILLNLG